MQIFPFRKTLLLLLSFILFISATLMLFLKIESTLNATILVEERNNYLMLDSSTVYKIGSRSHLSISFGNKIFKVSINQVKYDKDSNLFKAEIYNLNKILIPNTTIPVKVTYDSKRLYETII